MPPFKDEHILIIAPGSFTTLAQLGLPESFAPATTRIRTRMFPTPNRNTFEPHKVRSIKKPSKKADDRDVRMEGTASDDDEVFEEDTESDEGAVYPLTEGRITNMPAFLALLNHVHNILSPTLHTPILLIAQAAWTAQDHEMLTQFFFEKFKTPAFCIMDPALAVSYGYGVSVATVVDVGYQKVDITAVSDFIVQHVGRTISLPGAGGDALTDKLEELLGGSGWTRDMCEQLKQSSLCEVLPAGTPLPGDTEGRNGVSNPAAAASTGATSSGPHPPATSVPRGPGQDTEVGEEENDIGAVDEDGVLDVASIITSGKTQEFLAAQERKKAAVAARKATREANLAAEAALIKPVKLPNSKKYRVTFQYHDKTAKGYTEASNGSDEVGEVFAVSEPATNADTQRAETSQDTEAGAPKIETLVAENVETTAPAANDVPAPDASVAVDDQSTKKEQAKAAKREEKRKAKEGQEELGRREIEVTTERFLATSGGVLDVIADAIHRTLLAVSEVSRRSELWDSLIIVGNGSRIKGYKEALLQTLTARYLISPSSATIFTSELPSNMSTPIGTGSQTPTREYPPGQHPLPTTSGPNPLLVAATAGANPALSSMSGSFGVNGLGLLSVSGSGTHVHSNHSQTPTSIKTLKPPEYFPEFKTVGWEEAVFLGAQVAARVVFIMDQGNGGFMTRSQYNETGPSGIHEVGLAV